MIDYFVCCAVGKNQQDALRGALTMIQRRVSEGYELHTFLELCLPEKPAQKHRVTMVFNKPGTAEDGQDSIYEYATEMVALEESAVASALNRQHTQRYHPFKFLQVADSSLMLVFRRLKN